MKMTSKLATLSTLFAVALFFTATARASTVTYTLEYLPGAGTFELFAEASLGDNFGIATIGIPLTGSITSFTHLSPSANMFDAGFNIDSAGFTEFRSANDVYTVTGGQDTISPTVYLTGGYGQSASDFLTEHPPDQIFGAAVGDPWAAKLLVGTGTFTGDGSDLAINTASGSFTAAVFTVADLSLVTPPTNLNAVIVNLIPEPATLSLVLLSLACIVMPCRSRA